MTPQQFAKTWSRIQLKETAAAQPQFYDVCQLVGHCNLDPSQFTDFQRKLLTSQKEISQVHTVTEMQQYVKKAGYGGLPEDSMTWTKEIQIRI